MATLKELATPIKNVWCPRCGNFGILMAFKRALVKLNLEREDVMLVSGIGCHGKIVNFVNVNGFHGLHGRVLPLATGIKLANPNLTVVGFAGDADQYDEGWGHFSHALRRNIDMTLIVHNNMVLGLTTGQATATSQEGLKTKSTPFGVIPPALNPVAVALVSHGTFVARGFAGEVTGHGCGNPVVSRSGRVAEGGRALPARVRGLETLSRGRAIRISRSDPPRSRFCAVEHRRGLRTPLQTRLPAIPEDGLGLAV